jgi:hypothetical protein
MIVKRPRRGQDEIAGAHRRSLAIDRGIGTLSFDDEAQCRGHMPVAPGNLSRQHELHSGVQALRDL